MCVFRVGLLSLDNQLVCTNMETTSSSVCSFTRLPVVLRVVLRPCGLFPIPYAMFFVVMLVQPVFEHSLRIIRECRFWCHQETQSHSSSLIPWLLHPFCPLFHSSPLALVVGLFYRCIHWEWTPRFCTLIGCGFI